MSRFLDIQLDMPTVNRAAAGDREAQRQLYEQASGPMFALVRRVLRSGAAAEDVFQDSMMAVLKHLPSYRGDAPLGAWVRQVTLNQCLAHLRSPWQKARRTLAEWAGAGEEDFPLNCRCPKSSTWPARWTNSAIRPAPCCGCMTSKA
jgi:DNA-directed RNA polymerase specialized sigma24 family protein